MKKIIFCFFILLGLKNISEAQVNLNQGLMLHIPFDGNLIDQSPNNLSISQFGAPVFTTDKFNNANSALNLNGTNSYLEVATPNTELSYRDSMSFFLRFKTYSSSIQTLFTKVDFSSLTKKRISNST